MGTKKTIVFKIFTIMLWLGIGVSTIVLLVAAIYKKDAQKCKGISIEIKDISNNFFIDQKDVLNSITQIVNHNPVGQQLNTFDLRKIENELEKNTWIKSTEIYFDNNAMLRVLITERQPVARVYATSGETFYLDSSSAKLPVSTKFSARVPVFTGFPSDKIILSKADSTLLKDIVVISNAIQKDSFRMAMIEQIDIATDRTFEMIPKIGNQLILFGDATDAEEKFDKLQLFYEEVLLKAGLNKYSTINLQYKSQVVAKKRGAEDIAADAARTVQMMQQMAANAAKVAIDSVQVMVQDNDKNTADSTIIQQSIQRDEVAGEIKQVFPIGIDTGTKPVVIVKPEVVPNPLPPKKTVNETVNKKPAIKPKDKPKSPVKKTTSPNPISKPKTTTKNEY